MEGSNFMPAGNDMTDKEFELFGNYMREHSGTVIPREKAYLFTTRLVKLMADAGTDSFTEFYEYIMSGALPQATQKFVNAMVTNETLWFRDAAPWSVMRERLLPALVGELAAGRRKKVRIWFAAVSTGQEAYSTVMCVDEYLNRNSITGVRLSDFEFFATDISSRVLEIARKGRYDAISMRRGIDGGYRDKYFVKDGAAWELKSAIREAVRFAPFNLQNGYRAFGSFDIIFCRYVLIYFSDELKKETVMKMRDSLADGGVLFTGISALFGLFEDGFEANHYENLTYYSKKAVGK